MLLDGITRAQDNNERFALLDHRARSLHPFAASPVCHSDRTAHPTDMPDNRIPYFALEG